MSHVLGRIIAHNISNVYILGYVVQRNEGNIIGVAPGINTENSLSITADAVTVLPAKKLTNNAYLAIYDTNTSNVLRR